MASKGQSEPKEKKLIPAKCVRTHLGAFERTHDRTHEQGSNACPAGPSGYLRSNARDLRSNARLVSPSRHSGYSRSNAGCAVERE
jgi:hypothetical protein